MKNWIAFIMLSCCAVSGYSEEAPTEIVVVEEEGQEVAVDSHSSKDKGDCGCGKGKK